MKKRVTNCNGPNSHDPLCSCQMKQAPRMTWYEKEKLTDITEQQMLSLNDKKNEYIDYLEKVVNKAFKFDDWYELTTGESLENQQLTDIAPAVKKELAKMFAKKAKSMILKLNE